MSRYTVKFTARAQYDFNTICDWYEQRSARVADRWLEAVRDTLSKLESDPHRFPVASEGHTLSVSLQECLLGAGRKLTHRFVFKVRPDRIVMVYSIRHHAQSALTDKDLEV